MASYPPTIEFSLFTGPRDPLVDGFLEGGSEAPATGRQSCPRTWGVSEITLTAGGSSTSYDDRGHDPIPAGRDGHFYFAPFAESVRVEWTLVKPENAQTMIMELFRAGHGAPIWRRTFDAEAARKGRLDDPWRGDFPMDEWIDRVRFPHGVVTAADSPYMLKIRAEGAQVEDGFVERFTYFDILVESIELEWGGADLIPDGAPAGVDAFHRDDTIALERVIVADLARGGIDTPRMEVVLRCNTFLTAAGQMQGDHLYDRHAKQWGSGPRIPLLAKISLARGEGAPVHGGDSAKALGPLEILWDWESEDETTLLAGRYPTAAVRTYLGTKLDHVRRDGTGPYDSTNCHADYGGKRGVAGVFPTANGAFPHPVTACTTRIWASTSTPILEGEGAGHAGAIFQPSRMARDTYTVSAWLARVGGRVLLDVVDPAEGLRQQYTDLPRAATGLFDVVRSIDARYIRKAPSVEASNVAAASTQHALAGVRINWTATEDAAFQGLYETYIDRIRTKTLKRKDGVVDAAAGHPVPDWMEDLEHAYGEISQSAASTHAVTTACEYAVFRRKHLVDATRDYVIRKERVFNGPKSQYDSWRETVGPAMDDAQWMLRFYAGLSDDKKAKIDLALDARMQQRTTATQDAYRDRCALVGCHVFKRAGSQYMIETATDDNRGFLTYHVTDTVRFQRQNGTFEIFPSTHGGLAPSFETLTGKGHALLLIYLPTTVRNGLNNHYTVGAQPVIAHEAGHTFFLCHAPARPGRREAGGFSRRHHDPADMLCLMNYDFESDHLCGLCNLKLRGWSLAGMGLLA